ncbi:MAG: DUF2752 domain-containing protein [Clostridia bacterium]|nr:DUF2752 domain-containing protein [Clostridia bacterium]
MKFEQKARAVKLIRKVGAALAAGLIYLVLVRVTGWRIPCVFYELSGKYCPGCGITRMFVALSRLDFAAAAGYNLLALILLPVGAAVGVAKAVGYVRRGECKSSRLETACWLLVLALCAVFTVMRNMPEYAFLAP